MFQGYKYVLRVQLYYDYRYASVNALSGNEQSRRDDLESLGYLLVYLIKGRLPWQGLKGDDRRQKYSRICECKRNTTTEDLCRVLDSVTATIYLYNLLLKITNQGPLIFHKSHKLYIFKKCC